MTNIVDYASLQQAMNEWLERDDISQRIPDFIRFGELQLGRDLRSSKTIKRQRTLTIAGQDNYDLPLRYIEMRDLELVRNDQTWPLDYVTPKQIDYFAKKDSGTPKFFTIVGDELLLNPLPDGEYTLRMAFWAQPQFLSDAVTTNEFVTHYPDLILYASLMNAEPFLMNDGRAVFWQNAYTQIMKQVHRSERKGRFGSTASMQPVGIAVV